VIGVYTHRPFTMKESGAPFVVGEIRIFRQLTTPMGGNITGCMGVDTLNHSA
jgi:hypothetical protein